MSKKGCDVEAITAKELKSTWVFNCDSLDMTLIQPSMNEYEDSYLSEVNEDKTTIVNEYVERP